MKKIMQILTGAIIIFSLVYLVYNYFSVNHVLKKEKKYAVPNKSYLFSYRSSIDIRYEFKIKGKIYGGGVHGGEFLPPKLYFIEFYPPDPRKNRAIEVFADPSDLKNMPIDGYTQLPHR